MKILYLPTSISFFCFLLFGIYVFIKNRNQWFNQFFTLGIVSFAIIEFGNLLCMVYIGSHAAILGKRVSLIGECLLPTLWFSFTRGFAREEHWYQWEKKSKIIFYGTGITSILFIFLTFSDLFIFKIDFQNFFILGSVGKAFYIFFFLSMVAIINNLEYIIRQTKGKQSMLIKSFILGLGGLFAFLIYLTVQNLLFSKINLTLLPINSTIFFVCFIVIAYSVIHNKLLNANLYISRSIIYNSFTMIVIGGYLLCVGLISKMIHSLNILLGYPVELIIFFIIGLFLFSLLLSDRIQWKMSMFINRHFYHSRYDYRDEWLKLSEGLSQKLDLENLSNAIINILNDIIGVDQLSLWLYDAKSEYFKSIHSSIIIGKEQFKIDKKGIKILAVGKKPLLVQSNWIHNFVIENREIFEQHQIALLVPLVSGIEIVGMILLGKKKTGDEFHVDDLDLLRSSAAQITSAIMNTKLSQELIKAEEFEMFHRFSSFIMHDLKNIISSLSLLLQNAGEHISNPQFQEDMLATLGRSVKKMETLIAKLSNRTLIDTPNFQETDLNALIGSALKRMCIDDSKELSVNLHHIPHVWIDKEHIEKVIDNLLRNALEATDNTGTIVIQTDFCDKYVIISVSDNGHGISREFLENSLFKPFKSSKKKGLGIGLYQCKTIMEAHHGWIEVESKEGEGSMFKCILPILPGADTGRHTII